MHVFYSVQNTVYAYVFTVYWIKYTPVFTVYWIKNMPVLCGVLEAYARHLSCRFPDKYNIYIYVVLGGGALSEKKI